MFDLLVDPSLIPALLDQDRVRNQRQVGPDPQLHLHRLEGRRRRQGRRELRGQPSSLFPGLATLEPPGALEGQLRALLDEVTPREECELDPLLEAGKELASRLGEEHVGRLGDDGEGEGDGRVLEVREEELEVLGRLQGELLNLIPSDRAGLGRQDECVGSGLVEIVNVQRDGNAALRNIFDIGLQC